MEVRKKISIEADIPAKTAKLQNVLSVICNNPSSCTLTLNGIGFENVEVEGLDKDFIYNGEKLSITWKHPFIKGETRKVTVKYTVVEPITGLHFSSPTEVQPNLPSYFVTDHETERARYWLACVDFPTVRTTLAINISIPNPEYIALANGKEVSNDKKVSKWELPYPCPAYLITLALGEFIQVQDRPVNSTPIAYFAPKGTKPEDLKRTFEKTAPTMEWMQTRLGLPFPFKDFKYFQIVSPSYPSAMENITLTTWNPGYLLEETWANEQQLRTDLINCHEMAHSYFGDSVVIRHFDHAWLKESWAAYMEACWMEKFKTREEWQYTLYLKGKLYFDECQRYTRPIVTKTYDSSWDLYDDHLYPGGARRLHMLRGLLGDECFWGAVKEYLQMNAKSVVETEDFRKVLEKHSGLNLTPFFDQWIYSPGYPKIVGKYNFDPDRNFFTLELEQTQFDKAKRIPLFNLELPIEVTVAGGKTYTARAVFKDSRAFVTLELSAKPVQLLVDPAYTALFELDLNPGEDILAHTLRNSNSVPHRIGAMKQLLLAGTKSAYRVVVSVLEEEGQFYGLHSEAAKIAREIKYAFLVDLLGKLIEITTHPMAVQQVLTAATSTRHPRIRSAVLSLLESTKLNYNAHARALEILGYQSVAGDLELLKKHAEDAKGGWLGVVRSGAFRGISLLGTPEGQTYLLWQTEPSEPVDSRAAAVRCLGTASYWLAGTPKAQGVMKLQALLLDDQYEVRKAAVEGLTALNSSESVKSIEAVLGSFSNQDQVWVRRQIDAIRASNASSTDQSTLKAEIAELRERIAKLEEQLATKASAATAEPLPAPK